MNSIWRKLSSPRTWLRHAFQNRNGRLGLCLLHALTGVVVMPGCAWVRAQAQHRSAECEELCAKADREQQAGRVDQADKLLDEALKKSPRDVETQRQLADSLWQVGRQREALRLLTQIADEHPQDLRLTLQLAERYIELERHEEARNWVESALKTEPSSILAMTLKARIELVEGNDAAALATYQRISQQEAGQAAAILAMGEIHLRRGQPERAAPLLRAALAHPQAKQSERDAAEWELGVAYAQTGRWQDAATTFTAAAGRRTMSSDDWHACAYAAYRAGELDAAQTALDHALFLEPQHAGAQELLAALDRAPPRFATASGALVPASFERAQIR